MSSIEITGRGSGGGIVNLIITATIAVVVFTSFVGFMGGIDDFSQSVEIETGETASLDGNPAADQLRVTTTTNTQAALGGDSHINTNIDNATFEGNWSVGIRAEPDYETTLSGSEGAFEPTGTYSLLAHDNETVHILWENGSYTARYQPATNQSVYVAGTAAPGDTTAVLAEWNNRSDTLQLFLDGVSVDSNTTDNSTVAQEFPSAWVGGIDEVRAWNTLVGGGWGGDPVEAVNPANATGRLPLNNAPATPTRVFYSSQSATFVGDVEMVDGGATGPDLVEGQDYEYQSAGGSIEKVYSGYLDGQPIFFVGGNSFARQLAVDLLPLFMALTMLVALARRFSSKV